MNNTIRNLIATCAVVTTVALGAAPALAARSVDSLLTRQVAAAPLAATPVVITFDHRPTLADFAALKALGIPGGVVVDELPMVLTAVTQAQLATLSGWRSVISLYANHRMHPLTNVSRSFIGASALAADEQTTAANGGMPVSGYGVGVAYVDTGLDATHPDLKLGENVVQNVLFPLAEVPAELPSGFLPMVAVENQSFTDAEGGHGTFGAAVLAGTGVASGGFYGGVAPGARLVGLLAGNDVGLSSFAILQAYGYALSHQAMYRIRVCNNSWGTTLADVPFDPFDPVQVATRTMHDRNITVVFAAGNDGDAPNVINPYSVAPWVISVAAGEKQGLGAPASFSSRGNDDGTGVDVAGQPADPYAPPNLRPDLTGSGVDIKSARSKGPGITNVAGTLPIFVGANDLTTISPAFLPFYTTSQGTSFACPQVAGVVALMIEANPLLTPDEVVGILRGSATPMPYPERVVGAGYVDAHNAVRTAMGLATVPHPANLFPQPGGPEIIDPADDQLGTTDQDIRTVDFSYNASANQIVYTLTVTDLAYELPNSRWTMSSDFGATTIFVTAGIDETGATTFDYGRITTLATGTRNQETIGPTDSGELAGNQIIIRLGLAKVNAAVGFDTLYTTSTATSAMSEILIGTSFTGGLLLSSDSAGGSDFKVGEPPAPGPDSADSDLGKFKEHFSGVINPGGAPVEVAVQVRRPAIEAKLTYHPGNENVTFELLDPAHRPIASVVGGAREIEVDGLAPGTYFFRLSGATSSAVDFTIKCKQEARD